MSRLAVSTVRGLITAQVTAILAGTGKTRWCELPTASPAGIGPFLQIFPRTAIVCVHRSSLDVIRAGVQASPWGLQGQGLLPYLLSYPGNSVAALAAYWAQSTEQLLALEAGTPGATHRVRYEDVTADPGRALAMVKACLRLDSGTSAEACTGHIGPAEPGPAGPPAPEVAVPAGMIPEPLRVRIAGLHAELGYPPLQR